MKRTALLLTLAVVAACGGTPPQTRYYHLAAPEIRKPGGDLVLVLEPLTTDAAYDDERIVYRTSPYRLDYYDYHRWSASPGVLVGNYLEEALERGGHVRAVRRDLTTDADAILSGRIAAIEEVDLSKDKWEARIVIELQLSDVTSGETMWSEQYEEREPLPDQTPEGLARALSTALDRIVAEAGPEIAAKAATAKATSRTSR